ncbi:probable Bax inhibitor 1 [Bombus vosnesenskii]|uniref:Probable Bax inhibitor 1 n=2 Tax=Pyrobombus TaxID=144703 RepID=A0A6J3KY42_9HYME|nr:probable Bax inhibitor 1 [Bombus vancouverensis nearcticus]XP_033302837.1 probable Bax inhibitor 1 [Bombus bifarius]XP_033357081.1 probable Bax inhibitor 1 [Bombus vosnesenskii]XP_050469428.1 probable Bax inhibitor 1 [Bombus huntii]
MAAVLNTFVNSFTKKLEPPVRQHLKNVYGCLSMSMLSAAGGVYIHMFSELLRANLLTTLGTLGLLFTLINTPDNGKNQKLRLSYLLGFAFFSGLGLGPLLQLVMSVNPTVIVTALIGTIVIFVSFSISSLLAERGRWLYLGGTLISLLNIMVLFSFVNLFLRWTIFYQAYLYIGLFLMCGFVIYDTQLIIEKYHMGSKDFILHSLDLFVDFVNIFRHLLIILTQKEILKDQRKRRD